ncbi:MAG TPA: hypothetical protein PK390_06235, partial [Fervidobacterium nodosum]|nr:hypothetical protein [Fervidobacterium nodosum]
SVETTQNGNSVLLRFGKLKTVKVIKVGDGFGLVCKNKLLVPTEYGITESQLLCSKDIKTNRKKE